MTESQIKNEMGRLKGFYGTWKSKARRNLRKALYSPTIDLDNYTDAQVVGYYQAGTFDIESDTTSMIQENVIGSCISTLTSKIASQKARPFFNTVNGTFKDMQVVKQAQEYFDNLYDEINANKVITNAFRDSCIFDKGIIYIDYINCHFENVLPWQVYFDPREVTYGKITKVAWEQKDVPVSYLSPSEANKISGDATTIWHYWDINSHEYARYLPDIQKFTKTTYDKDAIPFYVMNYENPVKGNSSQSVVDLLYGIQNCIDNILVKMKDASELGRPLHFVMPEQSTAKVKKLTNRVGEIITYSPIPGQTTPPVMTVTDPVMDPSWQQWLQQLKQDAYELVGISQLSAMSQKPQGLNSGVGLSTLEDIESDRFEVQLNNVIRAYTDIAKLCISLFNKDTILPKIKTRKNIAWEDIKNVYDKMTIQFSAAENLSKDPSTKLQQLQSLAAAGLIPQSRIASLMELPDIQQGYSFANNALNAVLTVIDECIEQNKYDVPDYIPIKMLKEEIVSTMLSLKANSNNDEDIAKLAQLYEACDKKEAESQTSAEMMAVQTLSQELANAMPQMQQDMQNQIMALQQGQGQ